MSSLTLNDTWTVISIVLSLLGAGLGIWWFLIRPQSRTSLSEAGGGSGFVIPVVVILAFLLFGKKLLAVIAAIIVFIVWYFT